MLSKTMARRDLPSPPQPSSNSEFDFLVGVSPLISLFAFNFKTLFVQTSCVWRLED